MRGVAQRGRGDGVHTTGEPSGAAAAPELEPASPTSAGSALGRLVAATMTARGFTLDDVARRGGLALATVAALRSGTRGKRPRPQTLQKLALGLGLPLEQVLTAADTSGTTGAEAGRELDLLSAFRRLAPEDQVVAERLVRELARARAVGRPADG